MIDITLTYRGVTLTLKCTLDELTGKLPHLLREIEQYSTTPGLELPQHTLSTTYQPPTQYRITKTDSIKQLSFSHDELR